MEISSNISYSKKKENEFGNYDLSEYTYERINTIIKDELILNIYQDADNFVYYNKDCYVPITMQELIELKVGLFFKRNRDEIKPENKLLIFFKDIITNFEIINDYMNVLRNKGSSLPIKICIKTKHYNVNYYLDEKSVNFETIKSFLLKATNKYTLILDLMYKEKKVLRFLYGRQFRIMMKHFENSLNIEPFLRYILNIKDNNIRVMEVFIGKQRVVPNYIDNCEEYIENSFDNISHYLVSLFENNDKSLEKHYEKMKIIQAKTYKGIYSYECTNNSIEEFIVRLFLDKTNELPIAQNILFANKETSFEEMQSFLHRAILCPHNNLFIIEINGSFSESQKNLMNSCIYQLLLFKKEKYNEEKKENADIKKTQIYLDSCIVLIYKRWGGGISFLLESEKFDVQTFEDDMIAKKDDLYKNRVISELNNVRVITSDICGLGKSGKIKELIKESTKVYLYFPLGVKLTKNIIYNKLDILLNKLDILLKRMGGGEYKDAVKNKKYKKVAIHLDLTESNDISIINEFLFSFLITKFYVNNENIIYIPKDIDIYIEESNCFENYVSKFSILNLFNKENITFENMPEFSVSKEVIAIFNGLLGIDSNGKIKEFISKYIGTKKYSYHQINIFIKIFISQLGKFPNKIKFIIDNKDVTEETIEEVSKSTQYFTNNEFTKLLIGIDGNNKDDYIGLLSEAYNNDLRNMKFNYPLIFINKEKRQNKKLYLSEKNSKDFKNTKVFLKKIKNILYLPNNIEKEIGEQKSLLSILEEKGNKYIITNDNFIKMILFIYRIKANILVIIMGETGWGKTELIIKLNQLLNNCNKSAIDIIHIVPEIIDEILYRQIDSINEKAERLKDKEFWIFFDEINTCSSFSLIKELFINRIYNWKKISHNIRLIGACRPIRKNLSYDNDNENDNIFVYKGKPLPQSLLYYVFNFGSIEIENEKKYIFSMVEKMFTEEEKYLFEMSTEAISKCHKFLRNHYDRSIVSLREISRFIILVEFFELYFNKKNNYLKRSNNNKNNKLRSIICSIFLCYYNRLSNERMKYKFEFELRQILLKIINNRKYEEYGGDLMEQFKNEELKNEIHLRAEKILRFSDFIKIEQDFLIEQMDLDKGIVKTTSLKENIFSIFVSLITKIPIILIGKPASGKRLSANIIVNSMKGKNSKNDFLKLFPNVIPSYFQASLSTQPIEEERLFKTMEEKLEYYYKFPNSELPISMILFEDLD